MCLFAHALCPRFLSWGSRLWELGRGELCGTAHQEWGLNYSLGFYVICNVSFVWTNKKILFCGLRGCDRANVIGWRPYQRSEPPYWFLLQSLTKAVYSSETLAPAYQTIRVTINKNTVWIFARTETLKLVQAACSLASLADGSSHPQEVHDSVNKNPSVEPTLRYLKPVHTPTSYFFKTPFNITLPYYGQLFQVASSRYLFPPVLCMRSYARYTRSPFHTPWFDDLNDIWRRV